MLNKQASERVPNSVANPLRRAKTGQKFRCRPLWSNRTQRFDISHVFGVERMPVGG
jgi:hypothetical protein